MVSSTTSALLSLVGWTIVPDFATKRLLAILTRLSLPHLTPAPPGTLQHRKHYGIAFAVVVLGYLLYTMIESARAMPPNFYQILGVPPTADENALKLAFRNFAKKYHPDRPDVGVAGTDLFMLVRDSYEALKNPVVRFAYDRFGPDVLTWKHCSTAREYINHGLIQASGYHIVAGGALLFWTALGQYSPISFWRFTLFATLFGAELALILSPSGGTPDTSNAGSPPTILHLIFPQRTTYQHILFIHQLFMFLTVALTRVAPQLFPPTNDPNTEAALLERINAMSNLADREASLMLHTQLHSIAPPPADSKSPEHPHEPTLARMHPMSPDRAAMLLSTELQGEIEELIIEANLKKDAGPLRSAWEAAIRRGLSGGVNGKSEDEAGDYDGLKSSKKNFWERDEDVDVDIVVPEDAEQDSDNDGSETEREARDTDTSIRKDGAGKVENLVGEYSTGFEHAFPSPRPSPSPQERDQAHTKMQDRQREVD